jgi:hypothetical protein
MTDPDPDLESPLLIIRTADDHPRIPDGYASLAAALITGAFASLGGEPISPKRQRRPNPGFTPSPAPKKFRHNRRG